MDEQSNDFARVILAIMLASFVIAFIPIFCAFSVLSSMVCIMPLLCMMFYHRAKYDNFGSYPRVLLLIVTVFFISIAMCSNSLPANNSSTGAVTKTSQTEQRTIDQNNMTGQLSVSIEQAKQLLDSSEGKVADEKTREKLSDAIASSEVLSKQTNPITREQFENAKNNLNTAATDVSNSISARNEAIAEQEKKKKEAEKQQQEEAKRREEEERQRIQNEQQVQQQQSDTYYPNCDAVRQAGKAPLTVNDPGYASKLDRDHDGLACE